VQVAGASSDTPLVAVLVAGVLLVMFAGELASPLTRLLSRADRPGLSSWIQIPSQRAVRIGLRLLAIALIAIPCLIAYSEGPGL
jgi:hypothetical protein